METVSHFHEGGCLCGAVRYRVEGEPLRASVCSCTACQRRTGSLAGFGAYFRAEQLRILRGELKSYEHRSDESGRWLRFEFCPTCGTPVTWTAEVFPGMRAIGVGTLDQPKWITPRRFSWLRSAHPWLVPPDGVEAVEKGTLPPAEQR
jgi:hypothetical protein